MTEETPPPVSGAPEQNQRTRAGGRPRYKPTDEQRSQVRQLVGDDKTHAEIAQAIGVSPTTLRKHFGTELAKVVPPPPAQLNFEGAEAVPKTDVARTAFAPNYRQRQEVVLAKADDWSDERIARYLGIARNTLLKHFAEELAKGADMLRMRLLRGLAMAADKGSAAAAEKLLRLQGMMAPATQLPTPETAPEEEPLGKKAKAKRDAMTAHEGNSWGDLVKH